MIRLRSLLAAAALACAAFAPIPASAYTQLMCRGTAAGTASGPARWVAPASGTGYSLNNLGCAIIAQADVGDATAGGFVQSGAIQNILFNTGVLTGTTSVAGPNIPAGYYIREILVDNTTANAVTGGIDIGKTSGAADIVSALTCGASCLTFTADSALLLRVFSKTVPQTTFITGHTAGNSANLNITYVVAPF
jgi:hypothetical protein